MAKVEKIELQMSGAKDIVLNWDAAEGFLKLLNDDGSFKQEVVVFNNFNGDTEDVIYTNHIVHIKIKYLNQ